MHPLRAASMNYVGVEFPIELGQFGLMADLSPDKIPIGALIHARNISINEGRIQKAAGAKTYNATALSGGIISFYDWWPDTTTQRMLAATSDGFIYKDLGLGTFSAGAVASGLGPLTPNCKFVSGGGESAGEVKKLFFFSFGKAQLKVMAGDGTSFASVASPSTDWTTTNFPKVGVLHSNRLWAFAGQIAYASDTGDHENFTSNNLVIPCFPGEGGDIIGAFVFKTKLFVFKEDSYGYVLDDSSLDSDDWIWRKFVSNFGIGAPNAIAEVLNDLLMGNSEGTCTSFNATNALGDVDAGDLFNIAGVENWLRNNTAKVGVESRHMMYYPDKKLVFITYRNGYSVSNDMLIVIDFNKPNEPRIVTWKKGAPNCLGLRKDAAKILRPMYGSSDGKLYSMDVEDRLEGATAYSGEFQTPHTNCGTTKAKSFDFLSVKYIPEGQHTLSCDYYIDGKYMDTITFPMAQYLDPQLNTLLLNTDRLANAQSPETATRAIGGSGRTISFKFYNSGSNESFQVAGLVVGFRSSGEQAQTATGSEND